MKIDLHVHSIASADGELDPKNIIKMAVDKKIQTIAISDHDSMDSVGEAIKWGNELGVDIITASEVFAQHKGKLLHILGYGINVEKPYLKQLFHRVRSERKKSIDMQFEKIRDYGFYIDERTVFNYATGDIPLPSAYAYAILHDERNKKNIELEGRGEDFQNVIRFAKEYITLNKVLYVDEYIPEAKDVIEMIDMQEGIAVLAHPGMDLTLDETYIIDDLVKEGLKGLEVYYALHNKNQIKYYLNYCKNNNLIYTCGSDFHGKFKPNIELGHIQTPNNKYIVDKLRETIDKARRQS